LEQNIVSVNKIEIKDALKYNGVTLLTYRIEYPEFKSSVYVKSVDMINNFYKAKAQKFEEHCEKELLKQAIEEYRKSFINHIPVRVFEAVLSYKITYLASCIISLYFDQYEYAGGAHGNTVRDAQTWNLQSRAMMRLEQLIRCSYNKKAYIVRFVKDQIKKDPDIYFKDYDKLVSETFHENCYYCTPQAIVVYFQQYAIAPYASGIREFLIPYSNCVLDPKRLCRRI